MKTFWYYTALGFMLLTFSVIGFSCAKWKWQECRKVGFSVAYCIYDIGRH